MRALYILSATLLLLGCGSAGTSTTSAVPAGPRFAEARLATGVRLRWAEQGSPDGEPVIMLHGLTDSWHSFSRVLPELPPRYRVLVPDQRGHGDSDRPEAGYALEDFAADVLALMDELEIERAALVGHSMGSFVAQAVAAAAPERISRLVLVGSAADARTPELTAFQQQVEALPDPVPVEFAREFQLSTLHQPVPPEFLRGVIAASLRVPARVWRAALAGVLSDPGVRRLERIGMPTLLLYGERDAIWPRSQQDTLLALLPQATLRVYPDVGHAPHWERPTEFVRDLDAFLAGS